MGKLRIQLVQPPHLGLRNIFAKVAMSGSIPTGCTLASAVH
jgi:hypothetical protein